MPIAFAGRPRKRRKVARQECHDRDGSDSEAEHPAVPCNPNYLPDDLWITIFKNLNVRDACLVSVVCKDFLQVLRQHEQDVFTHIYRSCFAPDNPFVASYLPEWVQSIHNAKLKCLVVHGRSLVRELQRNDGKRSYFLRQAHIAAHQSHDAEASRDRWVQTYNSRSANRPFRDAMPFIRAYLHRDFVNWQMEKSFAAEMLRNGNEIVEACKAALEHFQGVANAVERRITCLERELQAVFKSEKEVATGNRRRMLKEIQLCAVHAPADAEYELLRKHLDLGLPRGATTQTQTSCRVCKQARHMRTPMLLRDDSEAMLPQFTLDEEVASRT